METRAPTEFKDTKRFRFETGRRHSSFNHRSLPCLVVQVMHAELETFGFWPKEDDFVEPQRYSYI